MNGNRNDMAWKVLKRDIVFQDTWVQLEASRCELPDGRIIEPFYVKRDPDFAVVVAVTKDGRLVLVRQSSSWCGEGDAGASGRRD